MTSGHVHIVLLFTNSQGFFCERYKYNIHTLCNIYERKIKSTGKLNVKNRKPRCVKAFTGTLCVEFMNYNIKPLGINICRNVAFGGATSIWCLQTQTSGPLASVQ